MHAPRGRCRGSARTADSAGRRTRSPGGPGEPGPPDGGRALVAHTHETCMHTCVKAPQQSGHGLTGAGREQGKAGLMWVSYCLMMRRGLPTSYVTGWGARGVKLLCALGGPPGRGHRVGASGVHPSTQHQTEPAGSGLSLCASDVRPRETGAAEPGVPAAAPHPESGPHTVPIWGPSGCPWSQVGGLRGLCTGGCGQEDMAAGRAARRAAEAAPSARQEGLPFQQALSMPRRFLLQLSGGSFLSLCHRGSHPPSVAGSHQRQPPRDATCPVDVKRGGGVGGTVQAQATPREE